MDSIIVSSTYRMDAKITGTQHSVPRAGNGAKSQTKEDSVALCGKKSEWAKRVEFQRHKQSVKEKDKAKEALTIDSIRQPIKRRKGSLLPPFLK
mmetsp:Transcript_29322/g.52737  ORF Transcript_29322/g.52737 Transcript_29322/m.52737 type:complete len:94 (+) Transcript_29322:367-648(+)